MENRPSHRAIVWAVDGVWNITKFHQIPLNFIKFHQIKYQAIQATNQTLRKIYLLIEPLPETLVGYETKPEAADHHVAQLQEI